MLDDDLVLEISKQWTRFRLDGSVEESLPAFLSDPLLTTLVAQHTGIVVQVLDMRRFKSVYVSPNVYDVCGFTQQEINDTGVWQWLKNLTVQDALFQVKNARVIHKQHKQLPPRTPFVSSMINGSMKTKAGERRRILSKNVTIEWDEKGADKFQLFLWRDATHLFRSSAVVVRHCWGPVAQPLAMWTYHAERGRFLEQDLLTERELEVLRLIEKELSSKDIAERLGISAMTVDNHRKNMIKRLQFKSTDGLIEVFKWLQLL